MLKHKKLGGNMKNPPTVGLRRQAETKIAFSRLLPNILLLLKTGAIMSWKCDGMAVLLPDDGDGADGRPEGRR